MTVLPDSFPIVHAKMTLLPETKSRKFLRDGIYRPHIVIGPTSQRIAITDGNVGLEHYLGVCFVGGPETIEPGQTAGVSFVLIYFPVEPYEAVVSGATFTLREGSTVVGFGTVLEVIQPIAQAQGT